MNTIDNPFFYPLYRLVLVHLEPLSQELCEGTLALTGLV